MTSASPVIWFLGLSGAGKSTLAFSLQTELLKKNLKVELLDGDVIRAKTGNNNFTRENRIIHLRQMSDLASQMANSGTIVIAAFITPYEESRHYARNNCDKYVEVWVNTSLSECEKRDVKGLYAKARRGEIQNFTGVTDEFEIPDSADIVLDTKKTVSETTTELLNRLQELGVIPL